MPDHDMVIIIPKDTEDANWLSVNLRGQAIAGESVNLSTATPSLSYIVPQSLADRVGRGAVPAEPPAAEGDADPETVDPDPEAKPKTAKAKTTTKAAADAAEKG